MEKTAGQADSIKPGRYFGLILLASVSGVLTALGLVSGVDYGPLAIFLWPLAAALQARVLIGMKAGEGSRLLAVLPLALTVASVLSNQEAGAVRMIAAALIVPLTAVAMTVLQIKKLGGLFTSAGAAAVGIGAVYAMVCLPGILSGTGAFTAVYNLYAAAAEELKETLALLADSGMESTLASLGTQIDEFVETVPDMTTGVIFLVGYCGGLGATLLLFALTAKKRETFGLATPGKLSSWTVPGNIFRPLILFYFVATVLYMTDVANALSIYYVVSVTFTFVTVINGFAMGQWLLERIKRKQKLFRALAYAVTAVLPMAVISPLSTLGFVECVFRIRRRFALRNRPNQGEDSHGEE